VNECKFDFWEKYFEYLKSGGGCLMRISHGKSSVVILLLVVFMLTLSGCDLEDPDPEFYTLTLDI